MNTLAQHLTVWLQIAAALQMGVAILNLFIVRLLGWKEDLARMPLLMREVFQVHAWFISVTLAIFAAMTWRFSAEMTTNPACRWLAGGIGFFWAIRVFIQFAYYSSNHWKGHAARTAIHMTLAVMYGGFAVLYLVAAFL
jgi:hypothetical protein